MMKENLSHSNDRRHSERRSVDSESVIKIGAAIEGCKVDVLDISRSGCGFVSDQKLAVGDEVRLGLDGAGTVRGWIISACDGRYGIEFEKSLATDDMINAFTGAKVITLYPVQAIPDVEIAPFARPIRLGIWVAAGALCWCGVLLAASAIVG
jgi:PilZ domain